MTVDQKVNKIFKILGIYEACGKENFTKYVNDTMVTFGGMEDDVSEEIYYKLKGLIRAYDEQSQKKVKCIVFNMISLLKK